MTKSIFAFAVLIFSFSLKTLAADVEMPSQSAPSSPPAMEAPNAGSPRAEVKGAIKMAKVSFADPKDGATVPKTFTAKFKVDGMKIASAGAVTAGEGHHHLIIDGAAIPTGQPVPSDATHIHFGKGQTETQLSLKPGPHTLTLQFADGAHMSYGEMMSQTIKINVK